MASREQAGQEVPVSPTPASTPQDASAASASVPDSWERPTGGAVVEQPRSTRGNRQRKPRERNQNQSHEHRQHRGEPAWHGDSQRRWYQARNPAEMIDPMQVEDPWASMLGPRTSDQGSLVPAGQKEKENQPAREDRRRKTRRYRADSPSSESDLSSSSSSETEEDARRRRDHGRKKVDHSRNVKIPVFDGVQKHYKEYRRAVKRYGKLVGKAGTGLALQLNLSGEAVEITKHLSARRLRDHGGIRLLLDTLDEEYLGLQEDRLDEVAEEFMTCRRTNGESMSRFIRRLREARRELEEEDSEMYVSNKFFSWMLLRRAGLTPEEKSRVRGAIHCSEDPRDISFALKRLFPSQKVGLQLVHDRRQGPSQARWNNRQALMADLPKQQPLEVEGEESEEETSGSENDLDPEVQGHHPDEVLAAVQLVKEAEKEGYDVYAMYKTAKMQQRGKSKSRGFFKKQASHPQGQSTEERSRELERAKATSTCRACGEVGHWARDPICPKFKSDTKKAFMTNAFVHQIGNAPTSCPLPLVDSFAAHTSTTRCHCPQALGILDSGCQRTVMGLFVFQAWESKLLELGVLQHSAPRQDSAEVFQFGNNGQLKSLFCVTLPVSIFEAKHDLKICVVAGSTPLLLSRPTISRLGLCIDFGSGTVESRKLGITSQPISEVGGHLVIDLLDDSLVRSCQGYKGPRECAGILLTGFNETPEQEPLRKIDTKRTKQRVQASEKHDTWFKLGTRIYRIHRQARMTLFDPHEHEDCPCPIDELDTHRISFVQTEPGEEPGIHQDNWTVPCKRLTKKPWTGCTMFVTRLSHELPSLDLPGDLQRCLDPILIAQLWPSPPKEADQVNFSLEKSPDVLSSPDLMDSTSCQAHPPTAAPNLDLGGWVTSDVFRSCQSGPECIGAFSEDDLSNLSPLMLSIAPDGTKYRMKVKDVNVQTTDLDPPGTENWFWFTTVGKRKLFATFLKHSHFHISPRSLRSAFREHGHVSSSQVHTLLGRCLTTTSSCEKHWNPKGQGRVDGRIDSHQREDVCPRSVEGLNGEGVETSLQDAFGLCGTSSMSLHQTVNASSGRTSDLVSATQPDCHRGDSSRRDAASSPSTLGRAVPVGRDHPWPSRPRTGISDFNSGDDISKDDVNLRSSSTDNQEDQGGVPGDTLGAHRWRDWERGGDGSDQLCGGGGTTGPHSSSNPSSSSLPSSKGLDTTSPSCDCSHDGQGSQGKTWKEAEPGKLDREEPVREAEPFSSSVLFHELLQGRRRTLSKADRQAILSDVEQFRYISSEVACLNATDFNSAKKGHELPSAPVSEPPVLLEVFAGSMHLSQVAHERGWTVLQPVDLDMGSNSLDLTTADGQKEINDVLTDQCPDLVTWAPPCGPYSPLQHIMPKDPFRRRLKWKRLLFKRKHTGKLWRYCLGHFNSACRLGKGKSKKVRDGSTIHLVENPWQSTAWKLFPFKGGISYIDQCCFGLSLRSGTKRKVKKPTRFQCSEPSLSPQLTAHCKCPLDSYGKRHDHIISGDKVKGRWISRSVRCGSWPKQLCHHLLQQVEDHIGWKYIQLPDTRKECHHVSFEKPSEQLSLLPYEVFAEEEIPSEPQQSDERPGPQISEETATLVYRLHCKFGHPANSTLARTLRLGGAKPEIVEAAKQISCSTCNRVRAPKDPPKVGVSKADQFNQKVGIDIFFIQGCDHKSHMVLSMVDFATSFHVMRLIEHRSPQEVSAVFFEAWIGVFGPPGELMFDQGNEFRTEFEYLLERCAVLAKVIPVETHWHGGVVERQGSTAKTIIRRLIDFHSVSTIDDLRHVLQEAASAKNSLSRQNGFSPQQWVYGYDNALPGSVLDRPDDLAVHDHLQTGGLFARKLNLRETARITWLQLDNSNRIRRAILQRPRQQRETFLPGETVYFYHLQQAGRPNQPRTDNPQCWHGPAVVVTQQGSGTLWLSWRRTLLRIPVENVRPATEEEVLGHDMVSQELQDHQKELSQQGSKARGFLDLNDAGPPVVNNSEQPLLPGQHVTTEEVQDVLGRRRVTGKRPPPAGFYDEDPASKCREVENGPGNLDISDPPHLGSSEALPLDPATHLEPPPVTTLDAPNLDVPALDDHASPMVDQDVTHQPQVSDMEDVEEFVHVPVEGDALAWTKGKFEELENFPQPYGPVKTWKDNLQERQSKRDSVKAQNAVPHSKFHKLLQKKRSPDPRDVFFSEVKYLQALEELETYESPTKQELESVSFEKQHCDFCGRVHPKLALVAGVDEPLSRDLQTCSRESSKTAKEFKFRNLTTEDQLSFREAMKKEWKSFLDLGAVKVVSAQRAKDIPKERILPTRFILTNKDDTGKTLVCKARLVCGGHLDPDIGLLRTDAPTADTMGVNLVFLLAASRKWVLQGGDISTAFLSGVFDRRSLFLKPPKEGLEGVREGEVLEMQKGVYGLCNAPRLWWRRLREVLVQLGLEEMKMMQCVFMYWARDADGNRKELMGIIAVHVDDLVISGCVTFEKILDRLKTQLTFGKWFVREFDYLGRHVRQRDDFAIEISQPNYPDKIPKVPISQKQLDEESKPVDEQTREDLRRTAGAACWLAKSTRPDLSFEVSLLQQSLAEATYTTVKQANVLARRAVQYQYSILIPGIDLTKPVVVAVSDASPGKMPRQGSQGGMFLLVSTPDIVSKRVPAACLFWLSHRLKRVARSSMATESMALCEATEHAEFLRACLCEVLNPEYDFRQWEKHTLSIPMIAATDCRSVYDHISAERGLPRDRILALDLAALRATFEAQLREGTQGRNASLRWLPGPHNLADGLTKYVAVQSLIVNVLSQGMYTLADEETLMKSADGTKSILKQNRAFDLNQSHRNSALVCRKYYPWQ